MITDTNAFVAFRGLKSVAGGGKPAQGEGKSRPLRYLSLTAGALERGIREVKVSRGPLPNIIMMAWTTRNVRARAYECVSLCVRSRARARKHAPLKELPVWQKI